MNKFTRDNYLKTRKTKFGLEKEMVTNNFNRFTFRFPYTLYTVKEVDIQRPDLISMKNYNRQDYWWFLMKYNGIDDVWNELFSGQVIKIPDVRDINDYCNRFIL